MNDLGDVLVVTPLFDALRRAFPQAHISCAVGSWARELLVGNPFLSSIVEIDAPWNNKYSKRQGLVRSLRFAWSSESVARLRDASFDVGIDLFGSFWGSLLLTRSRVKYRLGTLGFAGGEGGFHSGIKFDPDEHVGQRALRFAVLLGADSLPTNRPQLFLSDAELSLGESAWARCDPPSSSRRFRVVVAPGAGLAAKAWPEANYAALVSRLAYDGRFDVALVGGPAERQLGARLRATRALNLIGQGSLRDMCAFIAASDLVICNSSFVLHAAAAFSRPTLTLLGPAFRSASAHQRQWGYDGISCTLGPEADASRGLTSVDEAWRWVESSVSGPDEG